MRKIDKNYVDVVFHFGKEDNVKLQIEGNSEKEVLESIASNKTKFYWCETKNYAINLENVNAISFPVKVKATFTGVKGW